ncbi:MAG: ATP-dependent DNA helicase RecG [Candidatus Falkowbacteria bacterium GW2011_GWF2_39_8]|uniref:ATP-dependent DNA helicase RecG n=1 Tax=Candidatus Falkowbacteria bacterium GW2011_GWF2_39_8 TaxID=1618642 RepID=A0A0G0PUD1_9BACT|nr:MAG: ATP-dependent DNA helicase RecG [Candidatus Falkowbacteria bacterium GW2011_GWF2_39_8]
MLKLETAITNINRVGTATAKRLKSLGVETIEDLLFYFPFRYDDFSKITRIDELKAGTSASVIGQVELIQNKRSFRRKMQITEALVSDESGSVKVVWFNQPFIAKNLQTGDRISLAGKIEEDYGGAFMSSPVYEKIKSPHPPLLKGAVAAVNTQGFVPNYHLTGNLTQKQLRYLIKQVIGLAEWLEDWLPKEVMKKYNLVSLPEAIKKIHFPQKLDDVEIAKQRLAFDELFLVQLQSILAKQEFSASTASSIPFDEQKTKDFVNKLPFKLTDAQRKASWEILLDIAKPKPMTRLLEGDVGSGKTLVAILAMLNVAWSGKQAVLMAPTEILAKQHYATISNLLKDYDITVGLITRTEKKISQNLEAQNENGKKKKKTLSPEFVLKNSQIVVGTHAIIQEKIEFNDLALAVIDEQHRFGVGQRKTLINKVGTEQCSVPTKLSPHLLSMTATPIPRSLALALYGDLDVSVINEMPADRKKIITKIVLEKDRQVAYDFVRKEIGKGRQAFVICPLIEMTDPAQLSEKEISFLGTKSVKEEYEKLNKEIFPDLNIGMLHGKMKTVEKESVMNDFIANKIKVLVATSVVEVGVDIPNASIMLIEGAERFGLAQLHQFRGRVGRSEHQSYCLLFSESNSLPSNTRLKALVDYNDGVTLAKIDLKLRGPGEVYGTMQKGFPELKVASLFDFDLMKKAKEGAQLIVDTDSSLKGWPGLKNKVGEWDEKLHLE